MRVDRHTHRIRELIGLGAQPVAGQVPVSDGNQGASWGDVLDLGGAWQAYTPTLTNITLGNGTLTGYYQRGPGNKVTWGARLIFGSTTSVSGNQLLTVPPITPHARYSVNANAGIVSAHDLSTAVYAGKAIFTSTPGQVVLTNQAAPQVAYGATLPFTWATGDEWWVDGWYEAA